MTTLFCATESGGSHVIGYYTLSPCSLALREVPESTARKLPSYPDLPAYLLGRLAVDRRRQRHGLGLALLADAISRFANNRIAAWAIVVDAIDDEARAFYEAFGFIPTSTARRLFIPTETIARILPDGQPAQVPK